MEFLKNIKEDKVKCVVIIAMTNNNEWVICRHRDRSSFEFPGGHREKNETILDAAKRELHEETGAVKYAIEEVGIYKDTTSSEMKYVMLYFAIIKEFKEIPLSSEIDEIKQVKYLTECKWTYPEIQKNLIAYICEKNIYDVYKYIKENTIKEETGHDWWHINRVYNIAIKIAEKENANVNLVKIIALIHDLFDHKFFDGNQKIELKKFLKRFKFDEILTENEQKNIIDSCLNLGYVSNIELKKELSLEGKIVQDADRLDAIGAIGIARTFAYGGSIKREIYNPDMGIVDIKTKEQYEKLNRHSINHFYEKLLKLKKLMNTEEAKNIAELRHEFMQNYLNEFFDEWNALK